MASISDFVKWFRHELDTDRAETRKLIADQEAANQVTFEELQESGDYTRQLAIMAETNAQAAHTYTDMLADGEVHGAFISGKYLVAPIIIGSDGYIKDRFMVGPDSNIVLDGLNKLMYFIPSSGANIYDGGIVINESGITCYSTGGVKTFQAIIKGTNKGDVVLGDSTTPSKPYMFWDDSEGKLVIKGALTQSSAGGDPSPIIVYRGEWDGGTTYALGDIAIYGDPATSYFYIYPTPETTLAPDIDTDHWQVYAEAGSQGPPGASGATSYFHVAYCDDSGNPEPTFNQDSGIYIGTYTDYTAAESGYDGPWTWRKFLGDPGASGIPGEPGESGVSSYLHLAYASGLGPPISGFSTTDTSGRLYIGTLVDHVVEDSTDPTDYIWSLYVGASGIPGANGIDGRDGAVGPGIVYRGLFDKDTKYFNSEVRRDVVSSGDYWIYKGTNNQSGTWNIDNWETFGATFTSVATALLLAEDATILRTLTIGNGSPGSGIIRSAAKDSYTSNNSGFWIGYDSDGVPKFNVGDASKYFKWDGGALELAGNVTITGGAARAEIDSKVKVFRQDNIPTSIVSGDLWFDTNDDNKQYMALCAGADQIVEGEWVLVQDSGIPTAVNIAQGAQTTAEHAQDAADAANYLAGYASGIAEQAVADAAAASGLAALASGNAKAAHDYAQLIADGGAEGIFISGQYLYAPVIMGTDGYIKEKLLIGPEGNIALDGENKYIYLVPEPGATVDDVGGILLDSSGISCFVGGQRSFFVNISGANSGDVLIGNPLGNYVLWDNSDGSLNIAGNISILGGAAKDQMDTISGIATFASGAALNASGMAVGASGRANDAYSRADDAYAIAVYASGWVSETTPPTQPTIFEVTDGTNGFAHIIVSGSTDEDSGLLGYRIYRNNSSEVSGAAVVFNSTDGSDVAFYNDIVPSIVDRELAQITYYYWASAIDKAGNECDKVGPESIQITDIVGPPTVQNVTVKGMKGGILVNWTYAVDPYISVYSVKYDNDADLTGEVFTEKPPAYIYFPANTPSDDVIDIVNIEVTAVDIYGNSGVAGSADTQGLRGYFPSNTEAPAKTPTPTGTPVTHAGQFDGSVKINWTWAEGKPEYNVDKLEVWESGGVGDWRINTVFVGFDSESGNAPTEYIINGLIPGSGYQWKIRAIDNDGTFSDFSDPSAIVTPVDTTSPTIDAAYLAKWSVSGVLGGIQISGRTLANEPHATYRIWRQLDTETYTTGENIYSFTSASSLESTIFYYDPIEPESGVSRSGAYAITVSDKWGNTTTVPSGIGYAISSGTPVQILVNASLSGSGVLVSRVVPGYGVGEEPPEGAGLHLASDKMGYYDGGNWASYIDNEGNFLFSGNGDNKIFWDGDTLTIRGDLNADDITAGTITGRNIQTAATGRRITMSSTGNNFTFYNCSGNVKVAELNTYVETLIPTGEGNPYNIGQIGTRGGESVLIGDANQDGMITIADCEAIAKELLYPGYLTGTALNAADVTNNGQVTMLDASKILQVLEALETPQDLSSLGISFYDYSTRVVNIGSNGINHYWNGGFLSIYTNKDWAGQQSEYWYLKHPFRIHTDASTVKYYISSDGDVESAGHLLFGGYGTFLGNLYASGISYFNTVEISGINGITDLGALGVSGATSLNTLSASGAGTFLSTLGVSGNTSLNTLSASGAGTFRSTLGVSGAASFNTISASGTAGISANSGIFADGVITEYQIGGDDTGVPSQSVLDSEFGSNQPDGFIGVFTYNYPNPDEYYIVARAASTWHYIKMTTAPA